ncbi:MAG: hypothetical protein R3E40_09305 [Rhodocyclaceae bacterium]
MQACFNAVVKPLGETRPAWKVLRVLEQPAGTARLRAGQFRGGARRCWSAKPASVAERLSNKADGIVINLASTAPALQPRLERVADVPIHFADPLARRTPSAADARRGTAVARMNTATLAKLGLVAGMQVKVSLGGAAI